MSRYTPTLLFLLALLVASGIAINNFVINPSHRSPGYIPTLSTQEEGLMLLGGTVATVLVLGGMATGLAIGLQRLSQMQGQFEAAEAAAAKTAAKAEAKPGGKPAPAATAAKPAEAKAPAAPKAEDPHIPFTSTRSIIVLGVICLALFLAMQGPKYIGVHLGYIPMPSFDLSGFGIPGAPSEGLLFVVTLVGAIVLTVITGAALAFGLPALGKAIGEEEAKAKAAAAAAAAAAKAAAPAKPAPAAKPAAPAKTE